MNTITKEFPKEELIALALAEIAARRFMIESGTYGADVVEFYKRKLALSKIALASLDAPPVYFVEIEDDQDINAGRVEDKERFDIGLLPDGINFLYANPPVVNSVPIYQVQYGNDWCDVERAQYDDHAAHGSPVRVVYTAPPVPGELIPTTSTDI